MDPQAIPIPSPTGGVSEAWGYDKQPVGTARDAVNVVGIDPITGRRRLSQRAGLVRHVEDQIDGTYPITWGASIAYDDRKVTYTELSGLPGATGAPTLAWSTTLSRKSKSVNIKNDLSGNLYALDDKNVVSKFNSDGTLLYRISVPVEDKAHVCRALCTDTDGNFYVGVSAGGEQSKAALWRYRHEPDGKIVLDWKITTGRYFEDCAVNTATNYLYTLQTDVKAWRGYVALYTQIETAKPSLSWEKPAPYPSNALTVTADGSVAVASESFADRGKDPFDLTLSPKSVDWTPADLSNYQDRIHAYFDAADTNYIQKDDGGGLLTAVTDDGDQVLYWRDKANVHLDVFGYGRDWKSSTGTASARPTYRKRGAFGAPTLVFDATSAQYMVSEGVKNTKANHKDTTKQVLPGWEYTVGANGSGFLVWAVVKPTVQALLTPIFGHQNLGGVVRVTANSNAAFAVNSGTLMAADLTAAGAFTATTFDNANAAAIVVLCIDGFMGGGTVQNTFMTLNGRYQGRYVSTLAGERNANTNVTQLGRFLTAWGIPETGGADLYGSFEIAEMGVLRASTKTPVSGNPNVIQDDGAVNTDTEQNRLVGYLAHKYGLQHLLPDVASGDAATHIYRNYPPTKTASFTASLQWQIYNPNPLVTLYDSSGVIKSVHPSTHINTPGIGYGITSDSDGNFYTVGQTFLSGGTYPLVTKLIDNGLSGFSLGWQRTFDPAASGPATAYTYHYPRMSVDPFDNVYVPMAVTGNATAATVWVLDKNGTTETVYATDANPANDLDGYAVVPSPEKIDYAPDAVNRSYTMYVATDNGGTASVATVRAVDIVSSALNQGQPRTYQSISASGGSLYRWDSGTVTTLATGVLAVDAQFIDSAWLYGKLYIVDGFNTIVYDPKLGTVTTAKSTSSGSIPKRCKLICNYNGRLVLARAADDPFKLFASKVGDPANWDVNPPVPNSLQAFDMQSEATGRPQDAINAIIPYTDQSLIVGCENMILAVSGDPMDNARITEITRQTGMAFGRCWAIDDDGAIYFAGSKGGIYRMVPGAPIARISRAGDNRVADIERRIMTLNQSTHRIEMRWDYTLDGLWVFIIDMVGSPSSNHEHYFWERLTGGWWPIAFNGLDLEPTCAFQNNDPTLSERAMLIASGGYIRRVSRDATDDDGVPIATDVYWPISLSDVAETDVRGIDLDMASTQGTANLEVYASSTPEDLGVRKSQSGLVPGLNTGKVTVGRGSCITLHLTAGTADNRWALEKVVAHVNVEGQRRNK